MNKIMHTKKKKKLNKYDMKTCDLKWQWNNQTLKYRLKKENERPTLPPANCPVTHEFIRYINNHKILHLSLRNVCYQNGMDNKAMTDMPLEVCWTGISNLQLFKLHSSACQWEDHSKGIISLCMPWGMRNLCPVNYHHHWAEVQEVHFHTFKNLSPVPGF